MTSLAVRVCEPTDVAEARRVASRCAVQAGFDENDAGRVALVATELAANLVKHGASGEILVRAVGAAERTETAIEVLALDRGRGMPDVARCVSDGYSTSGSPGTGLGAVARASIEFDVYSVEGEGTAVLSRVARRGDASALWPFSFGAVSVSHPGELECGDAWGVATRAGRAVVLLADGLGHGTAAATAARRAREVFLEHFDRGPAAVIERVHQELRSTRGAAVSVTEIDPSAGGVRHCGLGNISAMVVDGGRAHQMVSMNGTAGHEAHRIREFAYAWPAGGLLVAHSDGLHGRWRIGAYRGLASRHPGLIAGVLYRDAQRGRDDMTVCALRVDALVHAPMDRIDDVG